MSKKLSIGFGNLYLIPFKNNAFELDTANQVVIRTAQLDSATETLIKFGKKTKTLVKGDGSKNVYTLPNEESGMIETEVLNPVPDALLLMLYPDASKVVDGTDSTKTKILIKDIPGLLLTDWDKMVKAIFKPVGASGELGAQEWVTIPRAILVPTTEIKRGAEHSSTKIVLMSVGGYDEGFEPEYTGSVSLASNVDLSDGVESAYAFDLSIDGTDYTVELGTGASTTAATIAGAINTEVGATVATIVNNKFKLKATTKGGSLTIAAPTGSFDNAVAKILTADAVPITVPGLAEGDIETFIFNDETATP